MEKLKYLMYVILSLNSGQYIMTRKEFEKSQKSS